MIHKKTKQPSKNKENIFNLTVQYFEKYNSIVQQLAYRDWHLVKKSYRVEEGAEVGDGRAEGPSPIRDRGNGFTHAWCWWNSCSHLWKSETWRFVCRGFNGLGYTSHECLCPRHLKLMKNIPWNCILFMYLLPSTMERGIENVFVCLFVCLLCT